MSGVLKKWLTLIVVSAAVYVYLGYLEPAVAFLILMANPFVLLFAWFVSDRLRADGYRRRQHFRVEQAEVDVARTLRRKLGRVGARVFNNIYVPNGRGAATQIDHVVVAPGGVFVIETKDWHGRIKGGVFDHSWSHYLFARNLGSRYNPYRQNARHAEAITRCLGLHAHHVVPVLCQVGRARLPTHPDAFCGNARQVARRVAQATAVFSASEMGTICWALTDAALPHDVRTQNMHIGAVRSAAQLRQAS